MFYKALTFWLFVVLSAGALRGQANDTAGYPTHPLAPVVIPWEPNGADYKLHTRELDSRPFPPTVSSPMFITSELLAIPCF